MNGTGLFAPLNSTVSIALTDESNNAFKVKCTTANIPSGVAGYAIGCELTATDTGILYTNVGTATVCSFAAVNTDSGGTLPISTTVTQTSATPGTVKAITGIEVLPAALTTGTVMGTKGEVDIPNSGTVATGTFLYGAQGKISSGTGTTIDAGSGYVGGVVGQLNISGATTTSGHIAPVIASIQDTTNSARPAVNAFYGELPTYGSGAKANAVLQGTGGVTTDLDFSGVHADFFAELASDTSTAGGAVATQSGASTGSLLIKVGSSTYKIPYFS